MDDWLVRATGTVIDLAVLAVALWLLATVAHHVYGAPSLGLLDVALAAVALKTGAWALRGRVVVGG